MILDVATESRSLAELRPALDEAFVESGLSTMLRREWHGDELKIEGPGATGNVRLEDGRLVVRARLSATATLFRSSIERKIRELLERAVHD